MQTFTFCRGAEPQVVWIGSHRIAAKRLCERGHIAFTLDGDGSQALVKFAEDDRPNAFMYDPALIDDRHCSTPDCGAYLLFECGDAQAFRSPLCVCQNDTPKRVCPTHKNSGYNCHACMHLRK